MAARFSVRAFWGLASWALPLAVVFFVTPQLLQALGPERFGVLMIMLVMPLIAAQLDFGITLSAVRRLAVRLTTGRVETSAVFTVGVALTLCGLVLGCLMWLLAEPASNGLGLSAVLGHEQGTHLMQLCGLWVAVALACSAPGLLARAAQSYLLITLVQTAATAALWIGALIIARSSEHVADVVLLGIGLNVFFSIVTAYAIRGRLNWQTPVRFETKILLADHRYSIGMFASQLASVLVYQFDRILVAAVGSPSLAGAYSLCINIANKVMAAVVALTSFAFPQASAFHASGGTDLEEFLHALERSVIVLVVPVILPGFVMAGPFLTLWVGPFATPELRTAFRLLWVGFSIACFSVPIANVLAASGRTALAARFAWLTAAVVIISIIVLVPRFSLQGAAFGLLLGMSTSLIFMVVARRVLKIAPAASRVRFWMGIAAGLGAQAAVLWAAPAVASWLELIAVTGAMWSAFYIVRVMFNLISPEEARLLKRVAAMRRP